MDNEDRIAVRIYLVGSGSIRGIGSAWRDAEDAEDALAAAAEIAASQLRRKGVDALLAPTGENESDSYRRRLLAAVEG